jgi:uncharacterized protein (TIGR02453 family)
VATFDGFSDRALDFYAALAADPTKEFWHAHKSLYETEVRDPMQALLDELEPEFGPGKLFRPYRDTRFSHDKTPYKLQQGAVVGGGTGVGYYVQLDSDGLLVGGGVRAHSSEQVDRYRRAVDADSTGREIEAIVAELRAADYAIEGGRLKTSPRGYSGDHPRIELLRHKDLLAIKHLGAPPWLATRRALDEVRSAWTQITPFRSWVDTHVGAP